MWPRNESKAIDVGGIHVASRKGTSRLFCCIATLAAHNNVHYMCSPGVVDEHGQWQERVTGCEAVVTLMCMQAHATGFEMGGVFPNVRWPRV